MEDDAQPISIALLVEPWIVLRPVNRDSVEYLEMRDSIAQKGFINSICVRPSGRLPGKYEIVDGLYRYNCARDLGRQTVPCIIKQDVTDEDVLALQVQANAIRPETTPTEFARQLKRILTARKGMTIAELGAIVHKNPKWLKDQLNLLNLDKSTQLMVDRGEIPIQNAYMLSKVPARLRPEYIGQASKMTTAAFHALVAGVIKQFTEAVQQGKMDARYAPDFKPVPYLRPLKEIKAEYEDPSSGALEVVTAGCKTPLDGWNAAIRWFLHLDQASVNEQRHKAMYRFQRAARRESEDNASEDLT